MPDSEPTIARHKAAIRRTELSLPTKCLVRDSLISDDSTFFDYGCGHGEDVAQMQRIGIVAEGWDPAFRPNVIRKQADVINLGYVLNVIEDLDERAETLNKAWQLANRLLVVAALVNVKGWGHSVVPFGDGIITQIGTFQKEYTQSELRAYIETTLKADALPAALGVFYVFKDEELKQKYVASKYRRRAAPRKRLSELRFEAHRDLLDALIDRLSELGRLPFEDEFEKSDDLREHFGSINRAFALIRRVSDGAAWDNLGDQQTQDLLVYLALSRFEKRPKFSQLPINIQRDIRAFCKSYARACQMADMLLFRAGDAEAIEDACKESSIGKLLPNALYVHRSALESLEPLLRIYEGCARSYLGEIEGANIIKLHRHSGKVSYLAYPDFDKAAHPALLRSVKLSLRTREIQCFDYATSSNPPVLHRKETFLEPDHPGYKKFAKLTKQEEECGLLDDHSTIGTRDGWERRLAAEGFKLRGHRLIRLRT